MKREKSFAVNPIKVLKSFIFRKRWNEKLILLELCGFCVEPIFEIALLLVVVEYEINFRKKLSVVRRQRRRF